MKKILALLFLFSALPLFGQGTSFPVFNRQGWTMAGAVVGTCQGPANPGTATLYCTSPVTTYTDWTLVVPCTQVTTIPNPPGPPLGPVSGVGCTNPGLTDSHGNATIFAANGFYWALVSGYQVVPQTFPFSIGGGGGGGGGNPCGTTYDVQLNISNGFGCDTGIFIETPSNHTTYNNVFSANQQLDVSDSAHTGILDIGHSSGTVVDGHWQLSAANLTPPGYGIDIPPTQPTTTGQLLSIIGSAPVADPDGVSRWHTQWVNNTGTGNCAGLAGISTDCAGPLPPTDPRSAVIQDKLCTMGDTPTCSGGGTTISCTTSSAGPSYVHCQFSIDQPIQPGDTGYVEFAAICGLGCTGNTHSLSDTAGNTWTQMTNADGSGSSVPAASYWSHMVPGATTFSVDFDNTGSLFTYRGFFHFVELRGTVTPDGTGYNGSSVSGAPSFQSVTTANATDTILGSLYQFNCAGTYTAGSGFGIINQFSGTVNTSDHISFGAEAENVSATGTYTPTITPTCGASLGSAFTQAFTQDVYGGPQLPTFRTKKYIDLVNGFDFPTQSGNTGKCLASSGSDTASLNWVACSTSSGTVTSVSGTTNQIDVATGTTTPVLSLSSTLIFPGTIAMGAHNADFGAATLFKIPVGAGATSSADGVIAYDSTAKSTHLRTNSADSIAAAFASAPAGSKCLHTNGTTGLITEAAADCGSSGLVVAGSSGDIQMNNGAGNLAAAHINDTGTQINFTEPIHDTNAVLTTPNLGTPSAIVLTNETGLPLSFSGGLGDGVNAMTAATYPMLLACNNSGKTWTIVDIHCYNDGGSSTLDVKNNAGTTFFASAPLTCNTTKTSGGASGTLGSTTTLASSDCLNVSFVADGTSKTTTWTVDITQ